MTTKDFRTFERHGTIMHPDQKDVVLFPEQVGGSYMALTRPMPGSFGRVLGIWVAESEDLVHWGRHRPVAQPRAGMWDEMRIGASLVPIRTDGGWLELYHGADRDNRYGMGALLLDAAVAHDDDRVAHRQRLFLVVGHVHERDPDLALEGLELELHLLAQLEVEGAERLVEEEHGGPVDERAGERDALLLAA